MSAKDAAAVPAVPAEPLKSTAPAASAKSVPAAVPAAPTAAPKAAPKATSDEVDETIAAETPKRKVLPSFPRTIEDAKAEAAAQDRPAESWSQAEIADAQSRCAAILKRIHAVATHEKPFREGSCGAAAPLQLISIGRKPEVVLSPPATVTCELAEGLAQWLEHDLQPLARKHFGAEIIKIENMSSYSCRNAYGRTNGKLSEHGKANALDIRGFVTASAQVAYVLDHWQTPARDTVADVEAAKGDAIKAAAEKAAAERAAQANQMAVKGSKPAMAPPASTGSVAGQPAGGIAKSTVSGGIPKVTVTLPGGGARAPEAATPSFSEPDRLGGPNLPRGRSIVERMADRKAVGRDPVEAKAAFLREAHDAACQIFGTTLGPEANAAHRNHFHVDMASRTFKKICE